MKHYVIIDQHSGYVWNDTHADSPVEACEQSDRACGEYNREYEDIGRERFNGRSGYHVYEVTGNLPVDYDGQDQSVIDLVETWPLVTRVVTSDQED